MPLSDPLPKNFDFLTAEPKLYSHWEQQGMFRAEPDRPGPPFVIVIPPPNVTGNLHMGHALDVTLQDILIRYHRMKGDNTLWMAGTDHAGIATQAVVERSLAAQGIQRRELGREKFVAKVWEWKKTYGSNISRQLRRLGASLDWSRERFTMDEGLSEAVQEVFVTLYEQNLIYRGERIINWCPSCRTAVSDIEVEHETHQDHLYYIKYLARDLEPLIVATTRPETLFGDTAVAVNPDDPRYQGYLGKTVLVPLTGRQVPVIFDSYVDITFGTGALKVTPAHDPNDFTLGRSHKLPSILAISETGILTDAAGPFAGRDRLEARGDILEALEREGLWVKTEPLEHAVGHCYRCRSRIEPLVSMQWFVKAGPLAETAAQAVRDGRITLVPASWEKTFFEWMDNIRDWCVSRQLWWGHQIPAWHCPSCGAVIVERQAPQACPNCLGPMERDPDVLDTWFSSALWPFSTLGWPKDTPELRRYYPTSVLVTGFDIIFFWVARMMMMGLKLMDDVPFRQVVLHPLVRDAHGQKMSKSKGNVVDPLEILDQYGADAFRFTLASQAGPTRDLRLDAKRIEGYSKFVNKIWNAARFALTNLNEAQTAAEDTPAPEALVMPQSLPDRWIRSRLVGLTAKVTEELEAFNFDRYCDAIYQFTWYEFCDWYLELIKPILYGSTEAASALKAGTLANLRLVFSDLLALTHPVMPFVTEELWSNFAEGPLMLAAFPAARTEDLDPESEKLIGFLMDVTKAVRQARSDFRVPPGAKVSPIVSVGDQALAELLTKEGPLLLKLMGADCLRLAAAGETAPKGTASNVLSWGEVWTPVLSHVDPLAEAARLGKEKAKLEKDIGAAKAKLQNPGYLAKAPAEVVEETREKLEDFEARLTLIDRTLGMFGSLGE
ncbi:MAG: valine--tRNA ligase [Deltaproteobacteria bacterium]|jgi:valyl-tRNA synthetase|nr:valine--tRNA ligase [Deltaproteobacteria bacterium]